MVKTASFSFYVPKQVEADFQYIMLIMIYALNDKVRTCSENDFSQEFVRAAENIWANVPLRAVPNSATNTQFAHALTHAWRHRSAPSQRIKTIPLLSRSPTQNVTIQPTNQKKAKMDEKVCVETTSRQTDGIMRSDSSKFLGTLLCPIGHGFSCMERPRRRILLI